MRPWLKTKLKDLEAWAERHSHFPFILANGCCKPEVENVMSSTYDWSRIGVSNPSLDPRECNVLIVSGWLNKDFIEEVREAYSELSGQRLVMAVGACAISGGPFARAEQKPIKLSDVVPVDVYIPGCPPRPEALIDAIRVLKTKMSPKSDQKKVLYEALRSQSSGIEY